MPSRRQEHARKHRRIEVRFVPEGGGALNRHAQIGYTGNLSLTGMMIRTPRVLPPGTVLSIELRCPERTLTVTGRVIWARQGPMEWVSTGRVGMGVTFVDPPPELAEIIEGRKVASA
jgi:hypothetical protein